MNCKNCGKELNIGDKFCSSCGALVEKEDLGFNPLFKIEAEKRTEAIIKDIDQGGNSLRHIEMDWGSDHAYTPTQRKTKDVDFNWESVLERKKEERAGIERPLGFKKDEDAGILFTNKESVEKQTKEIELAEIHKADEMDAAKAPSPDELEVVKKVDENPTLSIEELEREIFMEMGKLPERRTEEENALENDFVDKIFVTTAFDKLDFDNEGDSEKEVALVDDSAFDSDEEVSPIKENFFEEFKEVASIMESEAEEVKEETQVSESQIEENKEETQVIEGSANEPKEEAPVSESQFKEPEEEASKEPVESEITEKEKADREKFYTYHKKVDAFDELLNQIKPEGYAAEKEEPKEVKADVKVEAKANVEENISSKVDKKEENNTKEKLRYSDVFPRNTAQNIENANKKEASKKKDASSEMDLYHTKPRKKHVLLKIIISLLVILLVLEAALVLVRTFAPESQIAINFGEIVAKISEYISGLGK